MKKELKMSLTVLYNKETLKLIKETAMGLSCGCQTEPDISDMALYCAWLFKNGHCEEIMKLDFSEIKEYAVQQFCTYLQAETLTKMLHQKKIDPSYYIYSIGNAKIPLVWRDYYYGIANYALGSYQEAYRKFETARHYLMGRGTIAEWQYVNDSVRGVVSAVSELTMQEIYSSLAHIDLDRIFLFKLDNRLPSAKRAHVVGCDKEYLLRFGKMFFSNVAPLSNEIDFWLVADNILQEQLAEFKLEFPWVYIAEDYMVFQKQKTYFTMTRFILAEKLMRAKYTYVSTSDIDVLLKEHHLESDIEVSFKRNSSLQLYPWRSVNAIFSAWRGQRAALALKLLCAYFAEMYLPNLGSGNKQWWIDQYGLAVMADVVFKSNICNGWRDAPKFASLEKLPVVTHADMKCSKDEFSKINTLISNMK
jgi:hypothetical protein